MGHYLIFSKTTRGAREFKSLEEAKTYHAKHLTPTSDAKVLVKTDDELKELMDFWKDDNFVFHLIK